MTITGNKQATNKKDPSVCVEGEYKVYRVRYHNQITQRMQKLISLTKRAQGILTYFLLKKIYSKKEKRRKKKILVITPLTYYVRRINFLHKVHHKLNFFRVENIVDCSRDNYINSLEKSIMTTSSKGN